MNIHTSKSRCVHNSGTHKSWTSPSDLLKLESEVLCVSSSHMDKKIELRASTKQQVFLTAEPSLQPQFLEF